MVRNLALLTASLALLLVCAWHFGLLRSLLWQIVAYQIESEFPSVEQISIDAFEKLPESTYLLVDTRSNNEFLTSHIKGSINSSIPDEILREASKRKVDTVVLYCSVGYRSAVVAERTAERLEAKGGKGKLSIYNLEGSIFEWVNSGKPTYINGEERNIVHPYNTLWAQLLKDQVPRSEL